MFRFAVNQPHLTEDNSSDTLLIRQPVIILAQIHHEEKFCK